MKYIHYIFETGIFSAMIASAIAAVSKYYIPDKDSGVNVGRYPLVTTAKKKGFLVTKTPTPKVLWHLSYDNHLKVQRISW